MEKYGGFVLKTLNVVFAILIPMICLSPSLGIKNGGIIFSAILFTYCASAIPLYIYSLKTGKNSSWLYTGAGIILGAAALPITAFLAGFFASTSMTQTWNIITLTAPIGGFAGALFSSFFWTFIFQKNIIIKILSILIFIFFIFTPLLFLAFD